MLLPPRTPTELDTMREAGRVVAVTLAAVRRAAVPGARLTDLDDLARTCLREAGATSSFLGYKPAWAPTAYNGVLCLTPNETVVHGRPSRRRLRAGDLLSVDAGAVVDGWHGDAAVTVPVGECAPDVLALSAVTEQALWAGLAAVRPGGRLSDVGHAVESTVRPHGYGLLEDYTGHGIGTAMHEPPAVPNLAPRGPGRGMVLEPGMALAIEPMVTLGRPDVDELDDGWTVVTVDGSQAAHWEHSVAVTPDGPWVLTALDGGAGRLGAAPRG